MNGKFITQKIVRLCAQPRTFDFLCKNMDGLDPIQINEALKELETSQAIHFKNNLWTTNDHGKHPTLGFETHDPLLYLKKYMGYFEFLKTPHPLDFEWRNSTASLNYLNNLVQELNGINDNVLYLGMPTLFATSYLKDLPHKVTLVERNKPIIEGLQKLVSNNQRFIIRSADIFKVNPKKIGQHQCVIMDPPWYSQIFKQFMWLACQCVEIGGIVGISMPPLSTKNDILDERLEWIKFCHDQGLCIEYLRPQQLHYAMPFFEFNALRAAGVQGFPPFWRKGDLVIFRKICERTRARPELDATMPDWDEVEIDSVRIRVISDNNKVTKAPLEIQHLIKTDILPNVSKSDPKRKEANVWTSGNRIFRVNDTATFIRLLREVKVGRKYHNKEEQIVSHFVEQVTSLEKKEFEQYLQWLYYEMERQID